MEISLKVITSTSLAESVGFSYLWEGGRDAGRGRLLRTSADGCVLEDWKVTEVVPAVKKGRIMYRMGDIENITTRPLISKASDE
jgi:hypothetical protein